MELTSKEQKLPKLSGINSPKTGPRKLDQLLIPAIPNQGCNKAKAFF
jgi:hypothetical protein